MIIIIVIIVIIFIIIIIIINNYWMKFLWYPDITKTESNNYFIIHWTEKN